MKATELIGQKAIRRRPCKYAHGMISRSFLEEPIFIVNATEDHIVYQYPEESLIGRLCKKTGEENRLNVLSYEYCDDNWIPYSSLFVDPVEQELRELLEGGKADV